MSAQSSYDSALVIQGNANEEYQIALSDLADKNTEISNVQAEINRYTTKVCDVGNPNFWGNYNTNSVVVYNGACPHPLTPTMYEDLKNLQVGTLSQLNSQKTNLESTLASKLTAKNTADADVQTALQNLQDWEISQQTPAEQAALLEAGGLTNTELEQEKYRLANEKSKAQQDAKNKQLMLILGFLLFGGIIFAVVKANN